VPNELVEKYLNIFIINVVRDPLKVGAEEEGS
jgi:hypothetical protein